MNNPPINVLIQETKAQLVTLINESGLPSGLIDPILCSVLADIRSQSNLEMLNYVKELQGELQKNEEKEQKEEKKEEGEN